MTNENIKTLTEIMSECFVYDRPVKPLKEVAMLIGKPYGTLTRELNPDDEYAKLSVDTFMMMLQQSGDMRPLKWIADHFGFTITKKKAEPDKKTWEGEFVQDGTALGALGKAMDSGYNPDIVKELANELHEEINETVQKYSENWNEQH